MEGCDSDISPNSSSDPKLVVLGSFVPFVESGTFTRMGCGVVLRVVGRIKRKSWTIINTHRARADPKSRRGRESCISVSVITTTGTTTYQPTPNTQHQEV
jgi:hypothetical protein